MKSLRILQMVSSALITLLIALPSVLAAAPMTEPAYFSATTVTIIGLELAQNAPLQAQADFFEVVRHGPPSQLSPFGQLLGSVTPQCNPCDHDGMGIDFLDFHDHVIDSIPSSSSDFRVLWHVFLVAPAVSAITMIPGTAQHDTNVLNAYSSQMPATSEAAVMALLSSSVDGLPVAVKIDTHFFFLCAVVNPNASH